MKPEKRPRDGWPLRERQEQPAAAGQLGADQALLIFAGLVANWSQRVNCPQCGNRYDATACGPTHVLVGFHIQAAREIADA